MLNVVECHRKIRLAEDEVTTNPRQLMPIELYLHVHE
jgi:hypothetical protein